MTEITLQLKNVTLKALLDIPKNSKGLIIFAHGSGSGRLSSRNQFVAKALQHNQFSTLLLDLLTPEEDIIDEQTKAFRFDIPLLAQRLEQAAIWAKQEPDLTNLPIAFFGASTGAAAALQATSKLRDIIYSVVSRGGRPDLAINELPQVNAPTLLIIGGNDADVIELNNLAYQALSCPKQIKIVPNATHLFEEPGALEMVSQLATRWFIDTLPPK